MTMQVSFLSTIDVNLSAFQQARFTFPQQGTFKFEVFDGDFVEYGTVKVNNSQTPSGDTVIVILEEAVQPGSVVLPINEMLGWLNLRDHTVRLVVSQTSISS